MHVENTKLSGCVIIHNDIFTDERGFFLESYNKKKLESLLNYSINFVQDNQSFSQKGTLRGLHFQMGKSAQTKLVSVISGAVLDVAVDLRKDSPTFKQYIAIELNETNKWQLLIPRGFAHGFLVLSNYAFFQYKCDNFYDKSAESGIIFNDPEIHIDWQLPTNNLIVSEKDKQLKKLSSLHPSHLF
ncbi:MAG: dTDP-4-dehydrorhamnose 3,5-epimerase [Sediminibacterium sp.]|nr:dTDP-4-dehydrorhamnose 3,5-epimerase [Sediminibacterium sp.]